MEDLKELYQTGNVEEYIEAFERLRSKLLLENRLFTEVDFMDAFVGGLKPEIKSFVKVFHPYTLDAAYDYVSQMEIAVDTQFRRFQTIPKPIPVSVPHKVTTTPSPNRNNALIEQRRALGQCFKCGDKYFSGHQCKIKVQMLLGQELPEDDVAIALNKVDTVIDTPAEEAVVSMYANHLNLHINTMRFKG
jgi:Ty3 transposon capsid-like protein